MKVVRTKLTRLTATAIPHYRTPPTAAALLAVDLRQRQYTAAVVNGRWLQAADRQAGR